MLDRLNNANGVIAVYIPLNFIRPLNLNLLIGGNILYIFHHLSTTGQQFLGAWRYRVFRHMPKEPKGILGEWISAQRSMLQAPYPSLAKAAKHENWQLCLNAITDHVATSVPDDSFHTLIDSQICWSHHQPGHKNVWPSLTLNPKLESSGPSLASNL